MTLVDEKLRYRPMDAVRTQPADDVAADAHKVRAREVSVFYGDKQALFGVSVDIPKNRVTSFIGPSGCGKSTFLRCINRMNDTIAGELMSWPSSSMCPFTRAEGIVSFMRLRQRRKVDLPQPEGPMNAVTRSSWTSIDTSLSACFSP